jgi:hypothetical protein
VSSVADFAEIVRVHCARYPLMQPQDYAKLAYQSEFGPAHLVTDEAAALRFLLSEWQAAAAMEVPCNPEPIGNGYCRFHLTKAFDPAVAVPALLKLFLQSAQCCAGTPGGLETRLDVLRTLPVAGMEDYLAGYRGRGCPAVHHSVTFASAYQPHYRVVLESLMDRMADLR